MRYIELNPVRAGMVADPADYPWSSYWHNALGQADDLIVPHPEFQRLSQSSEERHAAYRDLFKHQLPEPVLPTSGKPPTKAGY
jgi:putative transposase